MKGAGHFCLRQVCEEDAEDLLSFYSDLSSWMFNGNTWCNGIFSSNNATVDEMRKCILSWLDEYRNKFYIRFSVIDKAVGKPIGTIEVFGNLDKVKRGAAYTCRQRFSRLFGIKYLIVWAVPNATERIVALHSAGYTLFESESRDHYYMKRSSV